MIIILDETISLYLLLVVCLFVTFSKCCSFDYKLSSVLFVWLFFIFFVVKWILSQVHTCVLSGEERRCVEHDQTLVRSVPGRVGPACLLLLFEVFVCLSDLLAWRSDLSLEYTATAGQFSFLHVVRKSFRWQSDGWSLVCSTLVKKKKDKTNFKKKRERAVAIMFLLFWAFADCSFIFKH